MTDQSPATASETADKLARQAISAVGNVAELAVDIPKDTAKLVLAEAKKLVTKLESIVGD